ncbi:hypothetical protein LNO81_02420 [Klebsiella variicola subsp. variicola]|nr:hypothetical protein [Klebsiella variicola subsp. variicola]
MSIRCLTRKAGRPSCGAKRLTASSGAGTAGAYWYNGFHEDGVRSALDVVQGIAAAEGN